MSQSRVYGFFGTILDSLDMAVCLFDAEDHTLLWNDTFLRFFPEHAGHVYAGEPYRENLRRFYDARLAGEERRNIDRYIEEGIARHRAQSRPFVFLHLGRRLRVASLPTPDGHRLRIWQQLSEERKAAGPGGWDAFPIDLLDHIADGAMVLDQNDRIIATNDEFRALYDVPEGQSVIGSTLVDVVCAAWIKAQQPDRWSDGFVPDNLHFVGAPFEIELPGGRWRRVIARRSAAGIGYFTHSDITELKRQQTELKRALDELSAIAATDVLTGLANRRRFDEAMGDVWARCARWGTPAAVLLIDLDHFKLVNDRFGHAAGDECLRRVAAAVRGAVTRPGDLAARHGGEEFAVLLPNATAEEALAVAQSIRRAMRIELWAEVHPDLKVLTASVGICAIAAVGAVPADAAMRRADEALYRAKHRGRDRIEVQRA
ncbi:diguanylate cyclase [Xanthobacter dioxanivorans]|uniref:diguanylate cyclase n=1 Tax=Xanthobacter dioxanivorans TaxID=2528964 RepID=A0A974PRQ8_9HYPH|nr:sensor domain-containing diguanylate cyclase [Xanthobacter dioxanivorans]QRG08522.1 diguanylate cyclase [Xanthobacter dioxanivorans]